MNTEIVKEDAEVLNDLAARIHAQNLRWWRDLRTGAPIDRNVPEMLCLVHSEISEALEGYRKDLMDTHLPGRKMIEVELADAVIRVFDTAAGLGLDLGGAIQEKLLYNQTRPDHTNVARRAPNGKRF